MTDTILDALLENYTALLERIDSHTQRVADDFKGQLACRKGCDSCCRFLTLFPVEALALGRAFERLSPADRARIEENIGEQEQNDPAEERACPLLIDRACMLYGARPVICRTHGFPLYMEKDGEAMVDFCPKNFKETESLPKEALLSLEQLNTTLSAVNTHFISLLEGSLPERIPVSQAIYLCRDLEPDSD